jgi:hypothetical protein
MFLLLVFCLFIVIKLVSQLLLQDYERSKKTVQKFATSGKFLFFCWNLKVYSMETTLNNK